MKNILVEKRLIDKLVEEWNEDIDGNKMTNVTLNEYKNICGTCIINIVLLVIFLSDVIYFHWYLKKSNTNINPSTETAIN